MSGPSQGSRRGRGAGVSVTGYSRTKRIATPEWTTGKQPAPIPESAMYPVVARHLAAQGYTCWRDVSYMGAWIDLYGRKADGRSIAVELKVVDWRRAFRQAALLRNSAHEVWIALWAPYVHRATADEANALLSAYGIGLFSVSGEVRVVEQAAILSPRYLSSVVLPARSSHRGT